MANLLGALRFMLGADTAAFEQGMRNAEGSLRRVSAAGVAAGTLLANAITGALSSITRNMQRALETADKMGKASQSIGIPIEQLSALRFAADLAGVSFESLSTSMSRMARAMQEAVTTPTSTAARTFQALGIAVRDASGAFRPSIEVLGDLAERFRLMEDGAGKTALAMNIFGRAGAQMIPLLNLGRDGLKQAADEARRLGLILNDDTARGAEAFNDNMRRLRLSFDGLFTQIAAGLVPTLEVLSQRMFGLVSDGDQVKAIVESISAAFRYMIGLVAQTEFVFRSLGSYLMLLGNALSSGMGTREFIRRFQELREEVGRNRDALREFLRELEAAGQGFRSVVGKEGEPERRIAAPIIASARSVSDAMRRMRDEARAALDDIVQAPTETFVNKMNAINEAVRNGTITMRQYGQMVRQVTRENQQHWFDLGTATANALTTIFSKNKVAQIASIIILTSVAIMRALATLPPPFSWAQAALAAAVGAAQLANVRKTTMSGAGSAPTVSGGGGGGGDTVQGGPAQMLTVQGINPGDLFRGDAVRNLAEQLLAFQKDGGQVVIK